MLSACQKDVTVHQKEFAFVRTLAPQNVNLSGVTLVGEVLDLGRDPIADYGFEYIDEYGETHSLSIRLDGVSIEIFKKRYNTEFVNYIEYYYRAYVRHGHTVVYGEEKSFRLK